MRLGCGGCLSAIIVISGLIGIGAAMWAGARALEIPPEAAAAGTEQDAARAQQKLARLLTGTREPVVLSDAELSAFVSRNLEAGDWPFDRSSISLRDGGIVEIAGTVALGRLIAESPMPVLGRLIPSSWARWPIALDLTAHSVFERQPRRRLRLELREMKVGRQRVPTAALRLLFDPATLRFLRLSVPDMVDDIRVEDGRAVIRPTASRRRTSAAGHTEADRAFPTRRS